MIIDIVDAATQELTEYLMQHAQHVQAEQLGLDSRAGMVWVCDDAIVVEKYSAGRLDYYGGFEYVDEIYKEQLGAWVIYYGEDERVREHLQVMAA